MFGGHSNGLFTGWLSTVIPQARHYDVHAIEWVLMLLSVFGAAGMMYASYVLYTKRKDIVVKFTLKYQKVYLIVLDKYFVDEFYNTVFVANLLRLNNAMAWFDRTVIDGLVNLVGKFTVVYSTIIGWCDDFFVDGLVNGLANGISLLGAKMRLIQTGRIQHYAYVAFAGIVAILLVRLFL